VSTSGIEDDGEQEIYAITEEILERDGNDETNTVIMGQWNSLVGDKSYRKTVGTHGLEKRQRRGQTLRLLMSYTYGAPILDVSRSHTTTQHSR
jgi:hypothetical protein